MAHFFLINYTRMKKQAAIGGDIQCINKTKNPLIRAAKDKTIVTKLEEYLATCCETAKKADQKLPNQAGFCRFLGCGVHAFSKFATEYPELADWLCAVFEDEVLNAERSPTLLNSYLKRRLGYTEYKKEKEDDPDGGALRLVFEHNILEDGG